MSNTGQIKRYTITLGSINHETSEFVKYDDHVSKLSEVSGHVFDLEKMLKSTESSLIYSTERAETLTRELSAAEQRIAELEKELNDTKYLLNISSNMIRALNATE